MFRVSHLAVGLCELSVPAHLPLQKTESYLLPSPTISWCIPSVFHPLSASSVSPPTSCEACRAANLLFLFNKQRRSASQSKLTSKDINGWVRNQLTNSDTLMAAHRHTGTEAKLLWVSGFTSTNGFLSTGYQPVETRTTSVTLSLLNTHITVDCAHFETMMNFFHPQLLPPRPPQSCTPLQVENYTSLFLAPTLLVSIPVHTECAFGAAAVCFGRSHWRTLVQPELNQHGLEASWCVLLARRTPDGSFFFLLQFFSVHHCFARKDHGKCGFTETLR